MKALNRQDVGRASLLHSPAQRSSLKEPCFFLLRDLCSPRIGQV